MTLSDSFMQAGADVAHMVLGARFETFGAEMNESSGRALTRKPFPVDPAIFADPSKPLGRDLAGTLAYMVPLFKDMYDNYNPPLLDSFSTQEEDVQVWFHENGNLCLAGPDPDGKPCFFSFMPLEFSIAFDMTRDMFDNHGGRDFLSRFSSRGARADFGNGLSITAVAMDF
ncbi:MAG: hypothetical protein IIY58_05420 [Aeriscardovia sp.]|nr:hypothetical protein [Aeriscardovia sp.]